MDGCDCDASREHHIRMAFFRNENSFWKEVFVVRESRKRPFRSNFVKCFWGKLAKKQISRRALGLMNFTTLVNSTKKVHSIPLFHRLLIPNFWKQSPPNLSQSRHTGRRVQVRLRNGIHSILWFWRNNNDINPVGSKKFKHWDLNQWQQKQKTNKRRMRKNHTSRVESSRVSFSFLFPLPTTKKHPRFLGFVTTTSVSGMETIRQEHFSFLVDNSPALRVCLWQPMPMEYCNQ